MTTTVDSVIVVGASLAGHASAKALRALGFTGRITMIGGEEHRPYDRPPLSKEFLAGTATVADLALEAEEEDLNAEWIFDARAIGLDTISHTVTLSDGRSMSADAVVIATGSFAKTLGNPNPNLPLSSGRQGAVLLAGVHTLRTIDDAIALRAELRPGANLVVVGSGFVGLEVASTAVTLGVNALVLGSSVLPLSHVFGNTVANSVQRLQEEHGVRVRNSVQVTAVLGTERVTGVRLASGEEIPADIVLLGVGSVAAVDWLIGSGLALDNGVTCSEVGATEAAGIFAVGDCSAWFDPVRGHSHRIEHWTDSRNRPAIAMAALLGLTMPERALRPSYLWSDQCGAHIQFAGRILGGEEVAIEAGGIDTGDLFAVYRRAGEPVAVVGINQPKLIAQWRKRLTSAAPHIQTTTELIHQGE